MHKILIILFLSSGFLGLKAQETSLYTDSIIPKNKTTFIKRIIEEFSKVDTNYIEPQKYNYAFMLQNTNTIEAYRFNSKSNQSILLTPTPSKRIGPYFGWRWIFLGYTFDISHLWNKSNKQEFNLSLYSSLLGVDLFYKITGNDYKIKRINLGDKYKNMQFNNLAFDGFKATTKGINLYYIFNHNKFSYPAAFSQSTIQRRSAGSPLLGVGFSMHTIGVDWNKLELLMQQTFPYQHTNLIDESMKVKTVEYTDFSITGGYAYNWAFTRNWLLSSSLSIGVAYKSTQTNIKDENKNNKLVSSHQFNTDGILRLGLVWNNMKYYAGASAVFYGYNYSKEQVSINNVFGNINIYVGFNFNRKKEYK